MQEFTGEKGLRFRALLRDVAKGKRGARNLTREEAREALVFLFSDESHPAQAGAFLTAMRFKSVTTEEYLGFFDAIYGAGETLRPAVADLLNANGPYDGRRDTLQLSPAAAILASAAGVPVLLHSSDGLPPKRGVTSGRVLEALGIPAYQEPARVQQNVERLGFGFLHARLWCHGIERLRPVREILFYRSLLHSCEVMANPGGARRSIVGAAHGSFLTRFLDVQVAQGLEHVLSVKGLDGGDELPLQPTAAVEHRHGKTEQLTLDPAEFGLPHAEPLACQNAEETARRIRAAFRGEDEAVRDALIWNSGVRLYVGGKTATLGDGVALARETLASGAALTHLARLATA